MGVGSAWGRSSDEELLQRLATRRRHSVSSTPVTIGTPPLELTDELVKSIAALSGEALEPVDQLPADERRAVRARIVDERAYPEIAKDLRCSEAVVRKRVSRGLARLRDEMEGA